MKGFLGWFKGSTKIKRWMFLILVGIVLVCYGISEILVLNEISLKEVAKIVAMFVLGFTCVILGLVYIQKRTLELVIESNNEENEESRKKAQVNIQSLIFNKKVYEEGPKIVVIGGGEGTNTLIKGLKNYTNNITAIVTVSDYGKAPTDSRIALNLLPYEDVKGAISSLALDSEMMEYLMNYRLKNDKLKNLSFGDIYLSAMNEIFNDKTASIENAGHILNMTGKVLPVTNDEITICAELEDGTVVKEKDKIPEVAYEKVSKINRIYINPTNCKPAPGVLEAIQEADAIVIGPGSLYTNVIPNLLVKNVAKTIRESKAFKIYVSNIMTEPGQTDNYSISEHLQAIIDHAGGKIVDYCICDTGEVVPEYVRMYNRQGSDLVEIDLSKLSSMGVNVIHKHMSKIEGNKIRHDGDTVAVAIMELICTDLKFKDKQYDTQYILLNSKLKDQKKQEKRKDKRQKSVKRINKKIENKKRPKMKSKFATKYQDRIQDIKASDETRLKNIKMYEETGSLYNFKEESSENKIENTKTENKLITSKTNKKTAKRAKH
mgnify:FL=1